MANPVPGQIITNVGTDGQALLHRSQTIDLDVQKQS